MKIRIARSRKNGCGNAVTAFKRTVPLLILALALLLVSAARANVTINNAATSFSADTAANAPAAGWTTVNPITVTEGSSTTLKTNISVGTNVTLVLLAPGGFEFNTGVAPSITFSNGADITAASVSLNDSSTMTVTLTVAGTNYQDGFTISGLQARATLATPLTSGVHLYRPATGGGTLGLTGVTTGTNGTSGTSFGTFNEVGGAATQLAFTTQPAGAVGGANFATQPVVKTEDQFGNVTTNDVPANMNVTVTLTSGVGPLQGTTSKSLGTSGTATFTNLRIDPLGNDKQLTASVTNGLPSVLSSVFAVNLGNASKLVIQTQPSTNAVAGVQFAQQPVVFIEDAGGNIRTNDTLTVTAARRGGAGTLQGTLAVAAVAGVATFSDLSHNYATNITMQFTSTNLSSATSSNIVVSPNSYNGLLILVPGETAAPATVTGRSGTVTTQAVGTPFLVRVSAVDQYFNVINTDTDTIGLTTATDPNATLPDNVALINGTNSFLFTFGTTGPQTVTANNLTDGVTSGTSSTVNVSVPIASKLVIATQPTTGTAGTAFSPQPVIYVEDVFGNIVTSSTATITAARLGGAGILQGTTSLKAVAGVCTYTNLSHPVATNITIQFNSTGLTGATSAPVAISPGAFSRLLVLSPNQTNSPGTASGRAGTVAAQTSGTPFSVTVMAVDTNFNFISGISDTVGITCSDTNASLPANTALVDGSASMTLTVKKSGTTTITASDISDGTKTTNNSSSITVNAGPFVGVQILAPGEIAAPGTATGKSGSVTNITTDTSANITVNAVDANWNIVTSVTDTNSLTFTDPNMVTTSRALTAGTRTFALTFPTVGTWSVTTTDTNGFTATTPPITVNLGAFNKMQVLLPGETAVPGSATGKTGAIAPQTTDNPFTFSVNAVDAHWNLINTNNSVTTFSSSDTNATLPSAAPLVNGSQTYSIQFHTAGARTITATNSTKVGTSSSLAVGSGAFTRLQLLMPGETAAPGTASGKNGTPSARTAGTAFSVTANAVDVRWNVVTSAVDNVAFTSTDANAVLPTNTALTLGTKTFTTLTTFKTAGSQTLTVSDATDGTKTGNTSPATVVNAATFTKMQLLVPGETAAPGSTTGKSGTPNAQTPSVAFAVTVNAVDANWNLVSTAPANTIKITATDTNAILPASAALASGTKSFNVSLVSTGLFTLTATNVTDGTKTSSTSPPITDGSVALPQTISFGALSNKTYGDVAFSVSATASSGLPVSFGILSGPATIASNLVTITGAGSVTVRASQAGDSTYQPATNVDQSFTVAQAGLTVMANNQLRFVGASDPVLTGTVTGVTNGDYITSTYSTAATSNSPAGNYPIIPALVDPGSKLANYNVTTNNGIFSINALPLAWPATNGGNNHLYQAILAPGGITWDQAQSNAVAAGGYLATVASSQENDFIAALVTNTSYWIPNGGASYGPWIGGIQQPAGGWSWITGEAFAFTNWGLGLPNDGGNRIQLYSSTSAADGLWNDLNDTNTALVAAYVIEYNPSKTNQTITFGPISVQNYSVGSFVLDATADSGLPVSFAVISGPATVNGATLTITGVGTVTVEASQPGNTNYFAATNIDQTFSVIAATLTVVADNQTRPYGATNPVFTGTLTGVVSGDNITATYGTTATAGSPATTYPITPTLVDPKGLLVNYSVSSTNGTLTVTKAPLAVTANDASRAYGATNPIFTATFAGLMNNDPISPVFTTTATSNSPAGGYPITITGFQDPQNKLPNYTVSTIPGTLTIVAPIQSPTMQPLLHPGSGAVVITWTAVSNATYRVQYETGLKPSAWADLSPNVTATGATASYTDNSGAAGQRFYRILVVQ